MNPTSYWSRDLGSPEKGWFDEIDNKIIINKSIYFLAFLAEVAEAL